MPAPAVQTSASIEEQTKLFLKSGNKIDYIKSGVSGQPTMAVDTHIFRVSNRTAIAKGKTPLEVEKRLIRLVPDEFILDAHHWLILLGRYTCIARKPRCGSCLVEDLCEYKHKIE